MPSTTVQLTQLVAKACDVSHGQVETTLQLLDDGNTIPFIARYRKHLTESLDDNQLRLMKSKIDYFKALLDRKTSILNAIDKQGKLTVLLKNQINSIEDKVSLEQCYKPFKATRENKVNKAEEAGLRLLADHLWNSPRQPIDKVAKSYINIQKGFSTNDDVIAGALAIAIDNLVKDVALMVQLKEYLLDKATLSSSVIKSKKQAAVNFKDYFDFNSRLNRLPAHRVLAMLRGKSEGYLRLKINADPFQKETSKYSYCQTIIAKYLNIYLSNNDHNSWHRKVIDSAWRTKLYPSLEKQLFTNLKEMADENAIEQFATNLTSLLMAAPIGEKVTLGLDPGFRSGCKLAVVSKTGNVLETSTIYPHQPQLQKEMAIDIIKVLLIKHKVEFIAIGNGTASRESEALISNILMALGSNVKAISVSEAGASVYSASELAAVELPNLDVTLRGAVSIARRLQDPLSELVKIEAKAIGVGLYQHDVLQSLLTDRLQAVVEDCVNKVGVDLNTASPCILGHIAGLNTTTANNIVAYREKNGRFNSRESLNDVPRLGPKAFQQAAGFLTVIGGTNCLDETILHPEQYPFAKKLVLLNNKKLRDVVLSQSKYELNIPSALNNCSKDASRLSIYREVISVLNFSRRDPRDIFETVKFDININHVSDLENEMNLQGVVTNVANFGAFVDIGVHQDGLVHISMLDDRFVDDPYKLVKVGQIVNVKVISIDNIRNRISLSMKAVPQP